MMIKTSFSYLSSFCVIALVLGVLTGCEDVGMDAPSLPLISSPSYPQLSQLQPPPPKIEEKQAVEDPLTSVWRDGYWSYNGSSYDWVSGDIIARPAPTAVWMSSSWERRQYGWAFVPGYWQ